MKVLILFYSVYGHIYKMAQAAAEGAGSIAGAQVDIKRVPETLPDHILQQIGAASFQKAFSHLPVCAIEELPAYDAILFGTPTRFGNMCGQMKQFLDGAGPLWQKNALVGKVGGVFTSSATQHGGQESTVLSFHILLLHLGFIIVGLPYSFGGQTRLDQITGGSPYGASTIAGSTTPRQPSANELEAARFQGRHIAQIAARLAA
jgi:NAD(P)H dehydrogenase (quinone)